MGWRIVLLALVLCVAFPAGWVLFGHVRGRWMLDSAVKELGREGFALSLSELAPEDVEENAFPDLLAALDGRERRQSEEPQPVGEQGHRLARDRHDKGMGGVVGRREGEAAARESFTRGLAKVRPGGAAARELIRRSCPVPSIAPGDGIRTGFHRAVHGADDKRSISCIRTSCFE